MIHDPPEVMYVLPLIFIAMSLATLRVANKASGMHMGSKLSLLRSALIRLRIMNRVIGIESVHI